MKTRQITLLSGPRSITTAVNSSGSSNSHLRQFSIYSVSDRLKLCFLMFRGMPTDTIIMALERCNDEMTVQTIIMALERCQGEVTVQTIIMALERC